jgi:hypothetical protein
VLKPWRSAPILVSTVLAKRNDREPIKRRRDHAQAQAIGHLVAEFLPHFAFERDQLRMIPNGVFHDAEGLFLALASQK